MIGLLAKLAIPSWIKYAVPALLAALLAIQTARMHSAHVERDAALATLHDQAERIKLVSAQAIELATRAKAFAEQRNKDLNDATDRQADTSRTVYVDRVMRIPAANTCSAGKADLSGVDPAASPAGPVADAIVVQRSDVMICAINQARLKAAHDWAVAMQAKP